jgi:hypothetical protein
MRGNVHVRFGGGPRGKGPVIRRNLAARPTLPPWGDLRRDWVNAYDVHRRTDENAAEADGSPG